jgi:hypothetical protein
LSRFSRHSATFALPTRACRQQQLPRFAAAAAADDLTASSEGGSFTPKSDCKSDCELLESGDSAGWNTLA